MGSARDKVSNKIYSIYARIHLDDSVRAGNVISHGFAGRGAGVVGFDTISCGTNKHTLNPRNCPLSDLHETAGLVCWPPEPQ